MDNNLINKYNNQYLIEGAEWNIESCKINDIIETYSGPGSLIKNTKNLINELNNFIKEKSIKSIIDVPCGDFNYMKEIDLDNINYHGFDIAENAINMCKKYEKENIKFEVLDATSQEVPQADLIICKDLFLHLSFKDIFAVLANIKDKCKYFAVSRYNTNTINKDQESGLGAREIEIQTPPFNFDKEIIKVIVYSSECANNEMVIYKM